MKRLLILLFAVLLLGNAFAQKTERDANYHFKSENYQVALNLYQELYSKDTANVNINYYLGLCYLNCNSNPAAALKHLTYVKANYSDDASFFFDLGKAYLYNHKFDKATEAFSKSKQLGIKNPDSAQINDLWIAMTENAKKFTRNPLDVSFVNLGKYINSPIDEITPVITADGEFLFFASNRKFDRAINLYTWDIYFSQLKGSDFKKAKAFTNANTIDDEFVAGISASGDALMIQLQGYEAFEDLAIVNRNSSGFEKPQMIEGEVNTKKSEYAATLTITGDTMIFSSAREGGLGGMDLYYSKRLPTGVWGVPQNLSNKINTKYDEDFPIMSPDGKTLYFCSNNDKSMGGFDIFRTTLLANGEFSQPVNIGYPLNDVYDNKTIAFSSNQRYAYVSAIHPDGYGYNDIYRVIFNQEDPSVKIFILNMKKGTEEQNEPYSTTDTTISVTAYQKGKVVFGKYAYISQNSRTTIALPPGNYTIEINGELTESKSLKLSVPDTPGNNKIEKRTVFLKPKE